MTFTFENPRKLGAYIEQFSRRRIVIIGDVAADHYIKGKTSRISREAPVLILKYQAEDVVPGQVGNTAANIAALGGSAMLVSAIGDDRNGRWLSDSLGQHGVKLDGIVRATGGSTLTKTRILAGGHHTARQQVIRIDDDERLNLTDDDRLQVLEKFRSVASDADAIIVSDYGYGLVEKAIWDEAIRVSQERKIPLVLDSRYNLSTWTGATLITPNEEEAVQTCGLAMCDKYDIYEIGEEVKRLTQCKNLIITRGNEGMVLFPEGGSAVSIPIFGSDECTDVTGAGDTVVAAVTLALAAGASALESMVLSNLAGALVVMKMGTATVSQDELFNSFEMIPQGH